MVLFLIDGNKYSKLTSKFRSADTPSSYFDGKHYSNDLLSGGQYKTQADIGQNYHSNDQLMASNEGMVQNNYPQTFNSDNGYMIPRQDLHHSGKNFGGFANNGDAGDDKVNYPSAVDDFFGHGKESNDFINHGKNSNGLVDHGKEVNIYDIHSEGSVNPGAALITGDSKLVFTCSDGLVVPTTWRCDGVKDCSRDGSDEVSVFIYNSVNNSSRLLALTIACPIKNYVVTYGLYGEPPLIYRSSIF